MSDSEARTEQELENYLSQLPATRFIEALTPDANGILRGKRVARNEFQALFDKGIKICRTSALLDSSGSTVEELGMGTLDGDPDCMARPVAGSLVPVPWVDSGPAQVMMSMRELDGSPSNIDPREVTRRCAKPLQDMGYRVVVATELEFYLVDTAQDGSLQPRLSHVAGSSRRQEGIQYAMLEDLWELDEFLDDIYDACETQGLPAGAALSEFAPGQFEINLEHVDDPVLACDHAVLLKRLIRGVASRHGLTATFMAKPFAAEAGNGLHIHASLYDRKGNNVFAAASAETQPPVSDLLLYAIAGLEATMAESMAICAPNANSYRRLVPGAFVPLSPNWGFNHRAVSLRIPLCDADNMRIEHRPAGADANPYLVMACMLAGMHHGIVKELTASRMIESGEIFAAREVTLPCTWEKALDAFEAASVLPGYLGDDYCRLYAIARRSECQRFQAEISDRDYAWYLKVV